jgi:hypothetical protein
MHVRTRAAFAPLLGLLSLAGCGPSRPEAADPQKSKELLRAVLDAWQQGEKPESLKVRSPAIHANDPDWAGGLKLERYEVSDAEGKPNGYDFNYPVTLWLRSGSGNARSKKVSYTIGTSSALVVVRDLGG